MDFLSFTHLLMKVMKSENVGHVYENSFIYDNPSKHKTLTLVDVLQKSIRFPSYRFECK